jgi:hypothetical protein
MYVYIHISEAYLKEAPEDEDNGPLMEVYVTCMNNLAACYLSMKGIFCYLYVDSLMPLWAAFL